MMPCSALRVGIWGVANGERVSPEEKVLTPQVVMAAPMTGLCRVAQLQMRRSFLRPREDVHNSRALS